MTGCPCTDLEQETWFDSLQVTTLTVDRAGLGSRPFLLHNVTLTGKEVGGDSSYGVVEELEVETGGGGGGGSRVRRGEAWGASR